MIENERKLFEQRINIFIQRLKSLFYEGNVDLKCEYCLFDPMVPFEERLKGKYKSIQKGQSWGTNWQRAWFHITGNVPSAWEGKHVCARINLGSEALLLNQDGSPKAALSFHTIYANREFRRDRIEISPKARGNENLDFWLEATAAQLFGIKLEDDQSHKAPEHYGHYEAEIQDLSLHIFRENLWHLYLDFYVLNDQLKKISPKSVRHARILHGLNAAIDIFKTDEKKVQQCRNILLEELQKPAAPSDLTTYAVGHSHIDTAWLWPIEETISKCARTFAAQIEMIEKYPDYIFGASQAQHYEYVKQHYPALYKKIKEKISEKRWEVQGGMWVEADANLISGESMIRQILYGKNFFYDEFGVEVDNMWLPDVFGYSASMPQIMKKSGIDFFITQKISWSRFNRFPHHTFIWRGIDGSEVVTHFPPEDDYNSFLAPSRLMFARENFDEKAYIDHFLTLFGIGDGGGGPTEEIIEAGIRQQNMEGVPRVKFAFAKELLYKMNEQKEELPLWVGELYLELHRATLTTQAYNKKMNRLLELRLRETEFLYALTDLENYPSATLDSIWKEILTYQFHDILPGSSIPLVYDRTTSRYNKIAADLTGLIQHAGRLLLDEAENQLTLCNSLSFTFKATIDLPEAWQGYEVLDDEGVKVPVQQDMSGAVIACDIEPLGIKILSRGQKIPLSKNDFPADYCLENDLIKYGFSSSGTLNSVFDKELQKEILEEKKQGNLLTLYEDRPVDYDAWDIDLYYENQILEQARLNKMEWIANGQVRQGLRMLYTVGDSSIEQFVYLGANSKQLNFETSVDWQETHKMLRVSFPTRIRSESAAFEIQHGYIKRPTHRNTSWDMAKFEVCAHRYADLSNNDYGVALLNNCKYGHKIYDNIIDLNLLRSSTSPDPNADKGKHEFTYSLLPHLGDLIHSEVVSAAAQLNQKPVIYVNRSKKDFEFPFKMDNENIILDAFKKAEKEEALIVRFYEPYGKQTNLELNFRNEGAQVDEVDLMEKTLSPCELKNAKLRLRFKPFEIRTLKLEM